MYPSRAIRIVPVPADYDATAPNRSLIAINLVAPSGRTVIGDEYQ
jgi:hypothetical protein